MSHVYHSTTNDMAIKYRNVASKIADSLERLLEGKEKDIKSNVIQDAVQLLDLANETEYPSLDTLTAKQLVLNVYQRATKDEFTGNIKEQIMQTSNLIYQIKAYTQQLDKLNEIPEIMKPIYQKLHLFYLTLSNTGNYSKKY